MVSYKNFRNIPKATLQWIASVVMAGVAAYFTTVNANWIALLGPFELWFVCRLYHRDDGLQLAFLLEGRRKSD